MTYTQKERFSMYIQKNTPYGVYETRASYKKRARKNRRRRRMRRLRNCFFGICVAALTLAGASELHLLKLQSDSKLRLATENVSKQSKKQTSSNAPGNDKANLTGEQLADTTAEDEVLHIKSVSDKWNLVLVNPWNPLPDNHEIVTVPLESGQSIDIRCYTPLMEMLQACRNEGLDPLICSSYRTHEKQVSLFKERVEELLAQGYAKKDARAKAATSVARPGTSEHELGLAVDIVDRSHQLLDYTQEYTMVQQWLLNNSWKYGFILRYPNDKSSMTGIIYEPWHYRYVGKKAAKKIFKKGICLEEYLERKAMKKGDVGR